MGGKNYQWSCIKCQLHVWTIIARNRNRKLEISTAPTKAKLREPAHSQALFQNKIDRQRVKSRESARRLWWMVFVVETGRKAGRRGHSTAMEERGDVNNL